MGQYVKHIILWMVLVPWLASSILFWLDGLLRAREFRAGMILGALPFALAYGVVGMLMCAVVTFPLSLLSAFMFARSANWLRIVSFRKGFIAFAAVVGLGLSAAGNKLLNTGRIEYLLLFIGFTGGVLLALLTLRLWNKRSIVSN